MKYTTHFSILNYVNDTRNYSTMIFLKDFFTMQYYKHPKFNNLVLPMMVFSHFSYKFNELSNTPLLYTEQPS